jgi:hypothetical protein
MLVIRLAQQHVAWFKKRFLPARGAWKARGEQHFEIGALCARLGRKLLAVDAAGQHHVGKQQIDPLGISQNRQGVAGAFRLANAVTEVTQLTRDRGAQVGVVLDRQNRLIAGPSRRCRPPRRR